MRPISNRDPADEQTVLFDDPPRCTAHGCQAGDRKNHCKHDADQEHGMEYKPRPRSCIASFMLGGDCRHYPLVPLYKAVKRARAALADGPEAV